MRKYIILLLLAICTQLSADGLGKETLIKGTAKLNGKDVPMWFNVTGTDVVEVGNGKNAAISQYSDPRRGHQGDWRECFFGLQRPANHRFSRIANRHWQRRIRGLQPA